MSRYLTLDDVEVSGKKVLVRSDLNVPLEGVAVSDDFRIRAALPTLERLAGAGADVTVCSHLGRPKGEDPALSLRPVAEAMDAMTELDVGFESGGDITVLENTRFDEGETSNDEATAEQLANGFDLFVQDAFGSVHRAHASTVGVAELVESVAGPLLHEELESLGRFLTDTGRPYTVVLGGAKVSDKLAVIENLLPKVDRMLIGGGMCFTFLAAQGHGVGSSLLEPDQVDTCRKLLEEAGDSIHLPSDITALGPGGKLLDPAAGGEVRQLGPSLPDGWMGVDVGPGTAAEFGDVIAEARTVLWNGPMGVFEDPRFEAGTRFVAEAVADCRGFTVIGGGDSAAAAAQFGVADRIDHISTGGGASLELIEQGDLPGLEALRHAPNAHA